MWSAEVRLSRSSPKHIGSVDPYALKIPAPKGRNTSLQWNVTSPFHAEPGHRNALLIQIWTALIAMLLLKWMHHLSKAKWSFSNLASMLRLNLFTYRDLRRWLENPFGTPPLVPLAEQLSLDLS